MANQKINIGTLDDIAQHCKKMKVGDNKEFFIVDPKYATNQPACQNYRGTLAEAVGGGVWWLQSDRYGRTITVTKQE